MTPSKSGVLGLLCAALGRTRGEPLDDLAGMRFGVRVERPGRVLEDFHTVGAGTDPVAVASGAKGRGIVTRRYYLQDSAFVVGLESADGALLADVADAVRAPKWPLALGRRSCPPAGPIIDDDSIFRGGLVEALSVGWRPAGIPTAISGSATSVELLIEDASGELSVDDQPLGAAFAARSFGVRRARSSWVDRAVV